jgi:probable F420-dependent oxidoreductase
MRIGVIFPQFEFSPDLAAVRAYAQTAEQLGYAHIGADDHVIGPNPHRPGGWQGWVTYQTAFFEPFTLFSFMAGVTRRIEFSTCVLLLPQRQTVLAAKQAATLDVLSGGRLRLGVGLGWNQIEYISLGQDFHNRGRRVEEQIELLRQLWTRELVDFGGHWHTVPDAGIRPLPVQRPIPIWFGGHAEAVLRRMARLGDGWMPLYASAAEAQPALDRLNGYLAEAGRERAGFGLEARLPYGSGNAREWLGLLEGWQEAGFTHLSLITTGCGFTTPAQHIAALQRFARVVDLEGQHA